MYDRVSQQITVVEQALQATEGIDDIQEDKVQCTKVVRNGILYILRNGETYTATGQETK